MRVLNDETDTTRVCFEFRQRAVALEEEYYKVSKIEDKVFVVGWKGRHLYVKYSDDGKSCQAVDAIRATKFTLTELEKMGDQGWGPASVTDGWEEMAQLLPYIRCLADDAKYLRELARSLERKTSPT